MWEMAPDQLERYRAAVADDRAGPKLSGLVKDGRAAGLEVMAHGTLKTAPHRLRRTIHGSSCSATRAS